jgi:3-hydroxyisobutyrate dehydrogenase-like beta-hydroxyacid dehydrogenase
MNADMSAGGSTVAVLGLGRMGAAMAAALVAAGHEVTVWNRGEGGHLRLDEELELRSASATRPARAKTPAEAVAGAEFVIAMLADGPALNAVVAGPDGVAGALAPGAVFCDMATSGVEAAVRNAERVTASGGVYLDAPVSGSVPTVRAGKLLVMASGPEQAVARVQPVFTAFAARVLHVGAAGAGQAMKLSVNAVLHILNGALSEGLVLAESGGVPREAALEVFASSVVGAPFVQYKRAAFADPDGQPVAFTVDLMRKDLGLVTDLAARHTSPVPLAEATARVTEAAIAAGLGAKDMSALAVFHRTTAQERS